MRDQVLQARYGRRHSDAYLASNLESNFWSNIVGVWTEVDFSQWFRHVAVELIADATRPEAMLSLTAIDVPTYYVP